MKTTNYYNTFIEIAPDCPVDVAEIPPQRKNKTAVRLQYEMVANHPYEYTSDDVIFDVFAFKREIPSTQKEAKREQFFSKGRACLRSSALGKRYGWGIHFDADGKIALYGVGANEYAGFMNDKNLEHLQAMRSRRA
ncbi:MAG TPA: DUF6157 family protein [Balneolaceae bacterium]|nr:DUF6157 family protein [Balneolaceae bacterium]